MFFAVFPPRSSALLSLKFFLPVKNFLIRSSSAPSASSAVKGFVLRFSPNFVAALGAEFCAGFELGAALGALVLGPQRLAAFRAELCPLRPRAARRTER